MAGGAYEVTGETKRELKTVYYNCGVVRLFKRTASWESIFESSIILSKLFRDISLKASSQHYEIRITLYTVASPSSAVSPEYIIVSHKKKDTKLNRFPISFH